MTIWVSCCSQDDCCQDTRLQLTLDHELVAKSQGKKEMMVAGAQGPQIFIFLFFSCIQPCSLKAETANLFISSSLPSCSWHVLSFQTIVQSF